jgi:hypothetical protein
LSSSVFGSKLVGHILHLHILHVHIMMKKPSSAMGKTIMKKLVAPGERKTVMPKQNMKNCEQERESNLCMMVVLQVWTLMNGGERSGGLTVASDVCQMKRVVLYVRSFP